MKLFFTILFASSSLFLYAQVFFSDSNTSGYYDSGLAFRTTPSLLKQAGPTGDKLPLAPKAFVDQDALEISWTSNTGGDWSALAIPPGFQFRNLSTTDTLGFWVYSLTVLAKAEMPLLFLEGAPSTTKSAKYPMADFFMEDLPAQVWTLVRIPLESIRSDAANSALDFNQIKAVIFGQGAADGNAHSLYVDQVAGYQSQSAASGSAPNNVAITNYPLHREITFDSPSSTPDFFGLVRNDTLRRLLTPRTESLYLDWPSDLNPGDYRITSYTPGFGLGSDGPLVSAPALPAFSESRLLDMTQEYTLRYFWDFRHPVSGLSRERNTSGEIVTIGGSGFGLMAWLVGVERGWLTREEVVDQLLLTLNFLEEADRFHGVWPHWMDGTTGSTIPFSALDNGGDLVETAFMAQALLTVRQYFDGDTPDEDSIRVRSTRIWEEIEWSWHQKPGTDFLTWHWSPDFNFDLNLPIRGYNEAQIVYILAAASPTFPVEETLYETGWIGSNYTNSQSRNGVTVPTGSRSGGPMFFAHYSYLGFDPRHWRDDYANYFERNQQHVDYQVAYSIENPENHTGYAEDVWGLTASDDPLVGYFAHEAEEAFDNGTLTPTAALASMPYSPEACLAALEAFYREYGEALFGPMGFYDAFNPSIGWTANTYLAIDQGPIVVMIENYRTGLLWDAFMKNPEIEPALLAVGFEPDSTTVSVRTPVLAEALHIFPNPSAGVINIEFPEDFKIQGEVTVEMYDAAGVLAFRQNLKAEARLRINLPPELNDGIYIVRTHSEKQSITQRIRVQK
jgi:hypothetical protein